MIAHAERPNQWFTGRMPSAASPDPVTGAPHRRCIPLGVILVIAGLAATGSVLAVPQRNTATSPFREQGPPATTDPGASRFFAEAPSTRR